MNRNPNATQGAQSAPPSPPSPPKGRYLASNEMGDLLRNAQYYATAGQRKQSSPVANLLARFGRRPRGLSTGAKVGLGLGAGGLAAGGGAAAMMGPEALDAIQEGFGMGAGGATASRFADLAQTINGRDNREWQGPMQGAQWSPLLSEEDWQGPMQGAEWSPLPPDPQWEVSPDDIPSGHKMPRNFPEF